MEMDSGVGHTITEMKNITLIQSIDNQCNSANSVHTIHVVILQSMTA